MARRHRPFSPPWRAASEAGRAHPAEYSTSAPSSAPSMTTSYGVQRFRVAIVGSIEWGHFGDPIYSITWIRPNAFSRLITHERAFYTDSHANSIRPAPFRARDPPVRIGTAITQ